MRIAPKLILKKERDRPKKLLLVDIFLVNTERKVINPCTVHIVGANC